MHLCLTLQLQGILEVVEQRLVALLAGLRHFDFKIGQERIVPHQLLRVAIVSHELQCRGRLLLVDHFGKLLEGALFASADLLHQQGAPCEETAGQLLLELVELLSVPGRLRVDLGHQLAEDLGIACVLFWRQQGRHSR